MLELVARLLLSSVPDNDCLTCFDERDDAATSGDCTLESGGDIGSSGKSSLNLDIVRCGVAPESERRNVLPGGTIGGGCFRAKDSRDVFENSEGVARPRSVRLGLRPPLLKKLVQELKC